jgi:hypothetical protein
MRWYKECSNKKPQQSGISPSRLKLLMIKREEERIRRLTEGSSEDEELQAEEKPTMANLSLILQPNTSHLYLNK